ncbi:MAG: cyclopropane fatty acyl phospholipid synthase [Gammaproteobacteria bacterium]|nr:cyclopropane fatty acyl phospholipid synthase [Gammaproteobacteria bacterium]
MNTAKKLSEQLLQSAGITINGTQPWDIQIHNEDVYERVLREGTLGLGESYMEGWWDCQQLDAFFFRVIRADLESELNRNRTAILKLILKNVWAKMVNLQTKKRTHTLSEKHYDLGNKLFQSMLDVRMNYTCGYWKNAQNLSEAQLAKVDLVCQKLMLQPGMSLLDIGCGFGAFAKYAAEKYGVKVTGITLSREQYQFAIKNCEGLPIEIRLQDYRDVHEKFDRIASIGMFEAVGHLNFRTYMQMIHRCLSDDGLFVLHTMGANKTSVRGDGWLAKHIFPDGMSPSIKQIGKSSEGLLVMEDWHNFGADYDKTLMAWHKNFNEHWNELKQDYDQCFFRMWNYYLLSCAGGFRAREMQLWQIVFSKKGLIGGYQAPR